MPIETTFDLHLELMEGFQFLVFDKGYDWGHDQVNELWDDQGLTWHVGVAENRIFVVMAEGNVADAVPVPVIASGGVGTLEHLCDGITAGGADAVLAASIFHFGEYTVAEAKQCMARRGIEVRL